MKAPVKMIKAMALPVLGLVALTPESVLAQGGYWGMGWFGGIFMILFLGNLIMVVGKVSLQATVILKEKQ